MKKKKNKRDKEKFPDLNERTTLKLRRDYIDNRHYVNGAKDRDGKRVIPELSEEDKEFLNKFNKEYYGASFSKKYGSDLEDDNHLHKPTISKDDVASIKDHIRELKYERRKIYVKKAVNTTDKDRSRAEYLSSLIDEMEDFINENFPKRDLEHQNNSRNRCFLNRNKASNDFDLISWETLTEDRITIDKDITLKKVEELFDEGIDDDED